MTELLLDEVYVRRAPQIIGLAQKTVRVSLYKALLRGNPAKKSSRLMLEHLVVRAKRGVEVLILLNIASPAPTLRAQNIIASDWMRRHGMQVRQLTGSRCNHAKFVIVDDSYAIVGSHNWSHDSLRRNHEASLVTEDTDVVGELIVHFDHLWCGAVNFPTNA